MEDRAMYSYGKSSKLGIIQNKFILKKSGLSFWIKSFDH